MREIKVVLEELYKKVQYGESLTFEITRRFIELEQENTELRAKLELANKIIDEYQQQIIPGFRERAEKAEKEIAKLRQQIEKMKNCLNCKYEDNDFDMEPCISCQDLNQWSEE